MKRSGARDEPETRPPLPEVGSILVFACNLLGDSVCRLPAIAAAKRTYPESRVAVVADPASRAVFEGQAFVAEVRAFARTGTAVAQARAWWRLIAWARRQRPDLVLDLYGSKRTAVATKLVGARWRAGLHRGWAARWYNLPAPSRGPVGSEGHMIQMVNQCVAPAGISAEFVYVPLAISEADRTAADGLIAERVHTGSASIIVLNPGARVEAKRWAPERFGRLARRVADAVGARPLVIRSPDEEGLADRVVQASGEAAVALPVLSLKKLAAVLARASVLVSGDTGVLHVGTAMGVPAVILAGPNHPSLVAYPRLPQVALYHRDACEEWQGGPVCAHHNTCRTRRCIDAITVAEAAAAVMELVRLGQAQ